MIEIKNVSKNYGTHKALDDVSIQIPAGEIIGLFGENGAGKTTLMKAILNLISYRGEILLDGEPITNRNIERLSFATGEHSFFANLTLREHQEFYKEHFPKFRDRRFEGLVNFFELPLDKKLDSFSTGQKNQAETILALCQGANYILMDEPFTGNDVFNREDFYKVLLGILEDDETIFISTHLIEEVSGFINRAILIRKGKIIGDVTTEDLEEQGVSLIDYVKEKYSYQRDRVSKTLSEIRGEDDENA